MRTGEKRNRRGVFGLCLALFVFTCMACLLPARGVFAAGRLSVNRTSVSIYRGSVNNVRVTWTGTDAITVDVSDPSICLVYWGNYVGDKVFLYFVGKNPGSTDVTIYEKDRPSVRKTVRVTVKKRSMDVIALVADMNRYRIPAGKTASVQIIWTTRRNGTMNWKSSDMDVCRAKLGSFDGYSIKLTLRALKAGKATITVYTENPSQQLEIEVTVKPKGSKVTAASISGSRSTWTNGSLTTPPAAIPATDGSAGGTVPGTTGGTVPGAVPGTSGGTVSGTVAGTSGGTVPGTVAGTSGGV